VADADSPDDRPVAGPAAAQPPALGPATISTEAQEIALVGMERHAGFDLKAALTAIGAELRTLYSDVLREPIPDRMAELLRQLDQPAESSQDTNNA
jgi:hypothetical protein